jgi:glycosyltransferase involved in cell wall biosynthesis
MLTSWALQHKGWKKRIAWIIYQRRDLRTAQVLHATSPAEVQDFRNAGLTQPVAMIPNGVEIPSFVDGRWIMVDRVGDRGSIMEGGPARAVSELPSPISHLPSSREVRVALFLSRIHPKKGLPDLLKAWALVRPSGWRVVIAGSDEGGHAEELKAEIRKLKLEKDFDFVGPVAGEAKWRLYRQADLFVLPSHSENFGIVVAEALASGIPVITTRATPWEELVTHRCGWWTENGPAPLAAVLREALSRTDEERREMGGRGRRLVEQKYSWPGIGAQMHAVYRWMLGEGERPECVA